MHKLIKFAVQYFVRDVSLKQMSIDCTLLMEAADGLATT